MTSTLVSRYPFSAIAGDAITVPYCCAYPPVRFYISISTITTVTIGHTSFVNDHGEGVITIPSLQSQPIQLKKTLHLAGSGPTLISLVQLQDDGYHLRSSKESPLEIVDPENKVVLTFTRQLNKFMWTPPCETPSNIDIDWHSHLLWDFAASGRHE